MVTDRFDIKFVDRFSKTSIFFKKF